MATVSLQTVFDDARRAIETGAADKAIGIAQHILVHFPRMIEGSRLLGEAYLNGGEPEQAAAAFAQVLAADPENVAAYYGRGLALQSMEQRPAAIACFERALEIQPNLADLRTQLMRLYSETPGSAGQFRLSRAGLGRLYARGGMFSQAIDEFRAVLDAEPDRDDVKVALAEALWRDGQEDEAMDYCRDLLEQQPELLKPTVLLSYMLFAAGEPEGEALWRRAAAQDATMALPRTLFDILPPIRIEEPVIPEFDEAEWRAQQAHRATQAQAAPVAGMVNEPEEDFFADSWLSSAGSVAATTTTAAVNDVQSGGAPAATQTVSSNDDDELLASLLGFDLAEPAAEASASTASPDDVQPFSFDEWDAPANNDHRTQSEDLPPSLNHLGLEDEQPNDEANVDIGAVKPFSLDDLSFDDEGTRPANTGRSTPSTLDDDFDLGNIEAFSLDKPDGASATKQPDEHSIDDVKPFSFDFDEEPEPAPGVQPFSLDEDVQRSSSVKPFSFDDDDLGVAPFSLEDEEPAAASTRHASDLDAELGGVQPFSLDDWGLDAADEPVAASETNANRQAGDDQQAEDLGDFKPFSLDELALDSLDEGSSGSLSGPRVADFEESSPERASFKWEEPSWRAAMTPRTEPATQEDESIFAKLMRNRRPDDESSDEPPAPSETTPSEDQSFFSMDDDSLRFDFDGIDQDASTSEFDDPTSTVQDTFAAAQTDIPVEAGAKASQQPGEHDALVDNSTLPFTLDELDSADARFSWETSQPAAERESEEMVPFSLSELGLSDDELATLDHQLEPAGDTAPDGGSALAPFSLADLGLTDDEIAALKLDDAPSTAQESAAFAASEDAQSARGTTDVERDTVSSEVSVNDAFSAADLGLSDDDMALLRGEPGQDEAPGAAAETDQEEFSSMPRDLPEAEHAAFTRGGDVGAEGNQSEWPDLEAERDVEPSATRTLDDYTPETMPFSPADIGLNDEEFALFDQAPQDQNVDEQAHAAPDGAAPRSPFADVSSAEEFFAPDDVRSSFEQEDSAEALAINDAREAQFGPDTAEPTPTKDDGGGAEQLLPADLPEGAQPLAAVSEAPAVDATPASQSEPQPSGDYGAGIAAIRAQLAADPENDALRLAVARMSQSINDTAQAVEHYRLLIRRGRLLDEVVVDLQDTIAENDDPQMLRRLHRLLGDAYMKQNRIREAMDEYSWTLPQGS